MALLRLLPAIVWFVGAMVILAVLLWQKPAPSVPGEIIAARDLGANHVLAAADLRGKQIDALRNRILLKPVKAGQPVLPDMVNAQAVPRTRHNAIAAIVAVSAAERQQGGIDVGSFVTIYQDAAPFGPPGEVMAVDCENDVCVVTVRLPRIPGRAIDPAALVDARLVPAAPPVWEPPPNTPAATAPSPVAPPPASPPPTILPPKADNAPAALPAFVLPGCCVQMPVVVPAPPQAEQFVCAEAPASRSLLRRGPAARGDGDRSRLPTAPRNDCAGR